MTQSSVKKAKISEVFSSIQGEGKYVGVEQLFIRFFDCGINCDFCDTKFESFREYTCEELLAKVKEIIGDKKIHSVSLTGGEPLLQSGFLLEFLPKLKAEGFNTYLETNGILHNELFDVLDYLDIISMDIKLPSSTKQKAFWGEHAEFLSIAREKDIFVKLVICLNTTSDDLKQAADLVLKIKPETTFILQPNSFELGKELANKLQEFKKYSKGLGLDARLIPQLHKILKIK